MTMKPYLLTFSVTLPTTKYITFSVIQPLFYMQVYYKYLSVLNGVSSPMVIESDPIFYNIPNAHIYL